MGAHSDGEVLSTGSGLSGDLSKLVAHRAEIAADGFQGRPQGFPRHLDLGPMGQRAGGGENTLLLPVGPDRLPLIPSLQEADQRRKQFAGHLLAIACTSADRIGDFMDTRQVCGWEFVLGKLYDPGQHSTLADGQIAQLASQPALRHLEFQTLRGGGFQVVRLIDDQVSVLGNHAIPRDDVGQQQGMVDDDHMGGFGGFSGEVVGTHAALSALAGFK